MLLSLMQTRLSEILVYEEIQHQNNRLDPHGPLSQCTWSVRNRGAQNQLWKRATGLLSFLADEPGAESASCVESLADFLFWMSLPSCLLICMGSMNHVYVPHTGVDVIVGKRDEPAWSFLPVGNERKERKTQTSYTLFPSVDMYILHPHIMIVFSIFHGTGIPINKFSEFARQEALRGAGLRGGGGQGKVGLQGLNLWSSKSGVDLQFLFHFQSWSLSFGCNNAGIWTSFSAFPVFFSQPLWRNDWSSTSASLFKSLDALSQGIEVVRRDWCLLAAGQQRCQSWCNMAYGCLWRMYIFEYLSPCLSYNIRMTLNNATCKICRCHVCKHLQTIAAFLGIRLRPGCHSYVFQSVKERIPSRQKWTMVGFGPSTL